MSQSLLSSPFLAVGVMVLGPHGAGSGHSVSAHQQSDVKRGRGGTIPDGLSGQFLPRFLRDRPLIRTPSVSCLLLRPQWLWYCLGEETTPCYFIRRKGGIFPGRKFVGDAP